MATEDGQYKLTAKLTDYGTTLSFFFLIVLWFKKSLAIFILSYCAIMM
jgi:hypothetical protein